MPRLNYGFPAASKSLKKFESDRAYRLHRQRLNSVSSGIDNTPPRRRPHLLLRLKQMQKEEERMAEVDYENQILLQKMRSIMQRPGRIDNWNDYESRSLNLTLRRQKHASMIQANVEFARRLEAVKPNYAIKNMENDFKQHEYLLEMLADPEVRQKKKKDEDSADDNVAKEKYTENNLGFDYNRGVSDKTSRQGSLPSINDVKKNSRSSISGSESNPSYMDQKLPYIQSKSSRCSSRRSDANNSYQEPESDVQLLFKVAKQMIPPGNAIISTLVHKTHSQRMEIKSRFQEKYNLDLTVELKNGLGYDWDALIDALLVDRSTAAAYSVHQALLNSNIPFVVEILASHSGSLLAELKNTYRKEFAISLQSQISKKISGPVELLLLTLAKGTRDDSSEVNEKAAVKDGIDLFESGTGRWTNESGKLILLVGEKSNAYLKAVFKSFKTASGREVLNAIKMECDEDFSAAAEVLVNYCQNPTKSTAEKLHRTMSATNPEFVQTLVNRSEVDMPSVKASYRKKYFSDLGEDIEEKCQHPTSKVLQELANKTPPKKAKGTGKRMDTDEHRPLHNQDSRAQLQRSTSSYRDLVSEAEGGTRPVETGRKPVDEKQKNSSITPAQSFNSDADCERLCNALKGFVVDTQTVIAVLTSKTNMQRQILKMKYKEIFNRDLDSDLRSKLRGKFEEVIMALMRTPAHYDAYCLHEALTEMVTDKSLLISVLACRTPEELAAIKEEYRKSFSKKLEDDVKDDVSGDFQLLVLELLKGQRDTSSDVNQTEAQETARKIYKSQKDKGNARGQLLRELFTKKNKNQIKETWKEYKKLTNKELIDVTANDAQKVSDEAYLEILKFLENPEIFLTSKLHGAFQGAGSKDTQLIYTIVTRAEKDLDAIKHRYEMTYKITLQEMIERESSSDYQKALLALVGSE